MLAHRVKDIPEDKIDAAIDEALQGRSAPRRMIVTFDWLILVRATKRSNGPARRLIDVLVEHPDHTIALSSHAHVDY